MATILSVLDFLRKLEVGSEFWYLDNTDGRPDKVIGPCTVLAIVDKGPADGPKVEFTTPDNSTENMYVVDITNKHHGVCTTKNDAIILLRERARAFSTKSVNIELHPRV